MQNYLKYKIIDTKHVTEAVPGESHSRPLPATPVLVFFHLLQKGEEQIMLRQEFVLVQISARHDEITLKEKLTL